MYPAIPQIPRGVLAERGKNVSLLPIQLETLGGDANNRITLVIKNNRETNGSRLPGEAALPQTVAQDDYGCTAGTVLFRQESAPSQERNAQNRKELRCNLAQLDILRHSRLTEYASAIDEARHLQG